MPIGRQTDDPAPRFSVGIAGQLGGAGHARVCADVGIGVHVQNVEDPVADANVDATVIAAADRPVCGLADLIERVQVFGVEGGGNEGVDAFVVRRSGYELGFIGAEPIVDVLELREIHLHRGEHVDRAIAPERHVELPAVDEILQ